MLAVLCMATAAAAPGASPARPKIGLVLGGGGARGAAHVGVLKVIEELKIPIDVIAGTSMGSIVGGLYAAGYTPEQIEHELNTIDWDAIFDDNPPRADQPWRRKRDDDGYLVKYKLGFGEGEVKFPFGVVQGQKFDLELTRLLLSVAGVTDFDQLRIPFRAVATDIGTGEAVVLSKGDLSRAIRASMAVPIAFGTVEIDGRLLVDGMLASNLPIDVARAMGADIVIVVDVGEALIASQDIKSLFGVLGQVANLLSRRNVDAQLATLQSRDVLITPALGDFSSGDFQHASKAIAIGLAAADAARPRLAALGVPAAEYARFAAQRGQLEAAPPVIAFVRLKNGSRITDEVIRKKLGIEIGQPLDRARVERGVADLYGLELFRSVRYQIVSEGAEKGLELAIEERAWGPDYLKFGLALSSDFKGESLWDIGVQYRKTAVTAYGGELVGSAQIGENPAAAIDFYQLLDPNLRWFIQPTVLYRGLNISRYEGDDEVEEYRVHQYGGQLAAGRELGRWGEFRVGLRRYTGDIDIRLGDPAIPAQGFESAEAFTRLSYDTLDNRNFPRSGGLSWVEWTESVESLGADTNFTRLNAELSGAYTWSRFTLLGGLQVEYTADGVAPLQNRSRIGGFTRLSGFAQNELSGQHVVLLRGLGYRRISDITWLPAYVGMSIEYGNVYEHRSDISLSPEDALLSASLFFGVELPVGPLYLGYGHTERGHDSLFLYLGRLF
ncbi:MAG TPA: patatin-like phospholipase family protein [Gammaproteobacteria bacterium]|nr:patatin-like phospholipase family protein [Gammaproteobacteria bacterium]